MYRRYGFNAEQTLDMCMIEFDAWLEALCEEASEHSDSESITGRMSNGQDFMQSGSWEAGTPGQ